ncbi:unnamed protein product [Caenorhabditis angaria]|uniref:Uncharacterized protein n=1 Tax=Caenorhabditis angaria TaxID=860376 RepID=A0A9P1NAB1_9PELO|nr:unnamed protein product [Caenorhabditis angaria]
MVLLNTFNRSYLEYDSFIATNFQLFFRFEISLIIFNICHTLFFLYINITAKQFHQNWTNVMSILYIQHCIADIAWIIDRSILISQHPDDHQVLMKICSYVRVICIFQGLLVLPILIIERCFATIYISDYESTKRLYISYSLVGSLFCFGCIASIGFHECKLHLMLFNSVLLFNTLGILGNFYLLYKNRQYYQQFQRGQRNCNLTERFQISENIKICKLVNMIVLTMGSFNGLICFTILIDFLNLSDYHRTVYTLMFDVSAILYSTIFPYICMYYSVKWKYRFKQIFHCSPTNRVDPKVELHDTFGSVMTECTSDAYFADIRKSWK